jgi:hypothetical protein
MGEVQVIVATPDPVGMIFDQPRARMLAAGRVCMAVRPVEHTGGEPLHLLEAGSRVWVREGFRVVTKSAGPCVVAYRSGGANRSVTPIQGCLLAATPTWRSSAAMPRWAARTVLTITAVERQRLLPLHVEVAESCGYDSPADFKNAWDARYRRHGLLHGSNPEVYAIWFSARLLPDWEAP